MSKIWLSSFLIICAASIGLAESPAINSRLNITIASAGEKADLKIDFNNPLKPGKITKFRVTAADRDRDFKLRVFSIDGKVIREWPKFTVLKGDNYLIEWDGKNQNDESVERGIYIVNLYDESDNLRINRRLAVIK